MVGVYVICVSVTAVARQQPSHLNGSLIEYFNLMSFGLSLGYVSVNDSDKTPVS